MPKSGPRTTSKYSDEFKARAVRPNQLPSAPVQDVADSHYARPVILSRWRKLSRQGTIETRERSILMLPNPFKVIRNLLLTGQEVLDSCCPPLITRS